MGVDLFRGRNERICVLCGSNAMMYEENPPTTAGDIDGDVDITCLECGFSEYTHFTELTLEKVNDLRIEMRLDEIKQFKERKKKRTSRMFLYYFNLPCLFLLSLGFVNPP